MSEQFFIKAKPILTDVRPYTIVITPLYQISDIAVKGKTFFNLKNLYLSASNQEMFNNVTLYDPFSSVIKLSASNLPFNAVKINGFSYSDNYISFTLPNIPNTEGYFDIIVENEAGYGKLTEGSIVPILSSYEGAINIQKPCIDGIRVKIQ